MELSSMKRLLFWGILCCLVSCKRDRAKHSFYYWKTSAATVSADKTQRINIRHFYIRMMDVDWDERLQMPVPVSPLSRIPGPIQPLKFTPVVFITNRTFERAGDKWCDSLAVRLSGYLRSRIARLRPDSTQAQFDEIQIDCDWTPATRNRYFRFLAHFKSLNPGKKLSATIRLYPYKYPDKMGVPPVDKGMLMCYNLGRIAEPGARNSVFDARELGRYLTGKKYALPLDIALPVFGWYAWFRGAAYKGILYANEFEPSDSLFETAGPGQLRLRNDVELTGKYLRAGDVLRSEYPGDGDLERAAKMLKTHIPGIQRVAFYHWDEPAIDRYEPTIQHIYDLF